MNISGVILNNSKMLNQINNSKLMLNRSNERLSTGKRVNSAADDIGNSGRIDRLKTAVNASDVIKRNIGDGISLLQTAEAHVDSAMDIGNKLKELSVQYNNGNLGEKDKETIEKQATELMKELENTLKDAKYNDKSIFSNLNTSIQTGLSSSDKYSIKLPNLTSTYSAIEQKTETVAKVYDAKVSIPWQGSKTAELTIGSKPNTNEQEFSIKIDNKTYYGKMVFDDTRNAKMELNVDGKLLKGEFLLNTCSTKDNIKGLNNYRLEDVSPHLYSSIQMSFKENKTQTVQTGGQLKEVGLLDLSKTTAKSVLSGDFVQNNILDKLSGTKTSIGIQQSTLERRLSMETKKDEINTNVLSRLEDVDTAKELLEKLKQELMVDTNASLLSKSMDFQSNLVYQLLR